VAGDTLDLESAEDIALADKMNEGRQQIVAELKKLIVGQDDVVNLVLLSLFVGGNCLFVGVPGSPRRCSSRRWPKSSTSSSTASSSRPT
jgi:hypothetical protein